jgi:hypothetical protein
MNTSLQGGLADNLYIHNALMIPFQAFGQDQYPRWLYFLLVVMLGIMFGVALELILQLTFTIVAEKTDWLQEITGNETIAAGHLKTPLFRTAISTFFMVALYIIIGLGGQKFWGWPLPELSLVMISIILFSLLNFVFEGSNNAPGATIIKGLRMSFTMVLGTLFLNIILQFFLDKDAAIASVITPFISFFLSSFLAPFLAQVIISLFEKKESVDLKI